MNTAPRVTETDVENFIKSEWYINGGDAQSHDIQFQPPVPDTHPLRLLTICVLVLQNGFTVTGESACVSPENYDEEIGRRIARGKAVEKIWPLLGFLLADQLAKSQDTLPSPQVPDTSSYPQLVLGQQVHFYERVGNQVSAPMLALVSAIHDYKTASLTVLAPNGVTHGRTQVPVLLPDDTPSNDMDTFARWI